VLLAVGANSPPTVGGGCIYVLQGTGSSVVNSGNALNQRGCGVYVDSSSNSAVSLRDNAAITPAPITGAPVTRDPFAAVSPPSTSSCTTYSR
jgi:hypothetical protein